MCSIKQLTCKFYFNIMFILFPAIVNKYIDRAKTVAKNIESVTYEQKCEFTVQACESSSWKDF